MEFAASQYPFRVDPSPSGGWTIWFPDLPGCSGNTERWEDIGVEACAIAELWLEVERDRNHPIPLPTDTTNEDQWPQGNRVSAQLEPILGVPDMAKLLGVSERRVQALAKHRGIGHRFGNYLVFQEVDIERLRPGATGRPVKTSEAAD